MRADERCRAASKREFRPHGGQRSGEAASVGGSYKRRRSPAHTMGMASVRHGRLSFELIVLD